MRFVGLTCSPLPLLRFTVFTAGGKGAALTGNKTAKHLDAATGQASFKHDKVDKSFSKALQQARLAKKMNQKDLATKINEKPAVINQYESGKAIPNPQIIQKLSRALGCQFPRVKKKK